MIISKFSKFSSLPLLKQNIFTFIPFLLVSVLIIFQIVLVLLFRSQHMLIIPFFFLRFYDDFSQSPVLLLLSKCKFFLSWHLALISSVIQDLLLFTYCLSVIFTIHIIFFYLFIYVRMNSLLPHVTIGTASQLSQ